MNFLVVLMIVAMIRLSITLLRGIWNLGRGPKQDETGAHHGATSNKLMRQRILWQGLVLILFFLLLYFGKSQ